jgi:hypothetical protein
MTTIPDMKPFSWVGVDFETYYDKECSVKTYGAYGYTHHENYDPYMVSIVADTFEWCGHPKDAPWEDIDGLPWVSHNATFDWHVYMQLQETYPHLQDIGPIIWEDSAGLAAYLRFPPGAGPPDSCRLQDAPEQGRPRRHGREEVRGLGQGGSG